MTAREACSTLHALATMGYWLPALIDPLVVHILSAQCLPNMGVSDATQTGSALEPSSQGRHPAPALEGLDTMQRWCTTLTEPLLERVMQAHRVPFTTAQSLLFVFVHHEEDTADAQHWLMEYLADEDFSNVSGEPHSGVGCGSPTTTDGRSLVRMLWALGSQTGGPLCRYNGPSGCCTRGPPPL